MTGNNIISIVREYLQDRETDVHKGVFWEDPWILLMVNQAQLILCRSAIEQKDWVTLDGLYTGPTALSWQGGTDTPPSLPADYMHYVSATSSDSLPCAMYLGATGEPFKDVDTDSFWIVGSEVYINKYGNYKNSGDFYYYKYPTELTATGTDIIDFKDEYYETRIARLASIFLGMMEPQTQREYKDYKSILAQIMASPKKFLRLLSDEGRPDIIVEIMRRATEPKAQEANK